MFGKIDSTSLTKAALIGTAAGASTAVATVTSSRNANSKQMIAISAAGLMAAATSLLVDSFSKPKPAAPKPPDPPASNEQITPPGSSLGEEELKSVMSMITESDRQQTLSRIASTGSFGTHTVIDFLKIQPLRVAIDLAKSESLIESTRKELEGYISNTVIPNLPPTIGPHVNPEILQAINNNGPDLSVRDLCDLNELMPQDRPAINTYIRETALPNFPHGLAPKAVHERLSSLYNMTGLEPATKEALDNFMSEALNTHLKQLVSLTEGIRGMVEDMNNISILGWEPAPQQVLENFMISQVIPNLGQNQIPDTIMLRRDIRDPQYNWGPAVLEAINNF